jgi:hypothetical protein
MRVSLLGYSCQTKKKEANSVFVCSSIVEDDPFFVLVDDLSCTGQKFNHL